MALEGLLWCIAALLGTDAKEIIVTDMVVHPRTKNAYVSVMRGQGTAGKPALLRVDGAGAGARSCLRGHPRAPRRFGGPSRGARRHR